MSEDPYALVLILVGGLVAGAINAVAGSGSIITLSLLIELIGLPAHVANATNRIGIFMNALGSGYGYYRSGAYQMLDMRRYLPTIVAGGICGVIAAMMSDAGQVYFIFKWLLLILGLLILWKPQSWMRVDVAAARLPQWGIQVLLFLIGVYGGYIQMGMGLFFLSLMILGAGQSLRVANPLKIAAVLIFTIIALLLFGWRGLIDLRSGILLGLGQLIGGWAMARYHHRIPHVERWIYRTLVLMVTVSLLKAWEVL